ncbi:J domain-containing protein [Paeniglutamicibacter sp. NPDC091659]|uniref:J domain-containing protein n=1 Tax=Paeniglutamicibacter sp. NPDC091659 TaxID=3364389 RepID=UPI0037FA4890
MESPDPYGVLRLGPEATSAEIARAFRALVRLHHPDTRPIAGTSGEQATERARLQEVMDAYAVLGDPVRRELFDRQHPAPADLPEARSRGRGRSRARCAGSQPPWLAVGPLWWEPPGRRRI